MKRFGPLLLAPVVAALAACGGGVTHGLVVGKHDAPAHVETGYTPIYRTQCLPEERSVYLNGHAVEEEETVCHQVFAYNQPYTNHIPEHWSLKLSLNHKTGWVDVSQQVYNTVQVGQVYGHG